LSASASRHCCCCHCCCCWRSAQCSGSEAEPPTSPSLPAASLAAPREAGESKQPQWLIVRRESTEPSVERPRARARVAMLVVATPEECALAVVDAAAGMADAGMADAGMADAGMADAGMADAGAADPLAASASGVSMGRCQAAADEAAEAGVACGLHGVGRCREPLIGTIGSGLEPKRRGPEASAWSRKGGGCSSAAAASDRCAASLMRFSARARERRFMRSPSVASSAAPRPSPSPPGPEPSPSAPGWRGTRVARETCAASWSRRSWISCSGDSES